MYKLLVVSPLASITKDQVVWLRSVGFEATFIGECETSDKELLGGKRKVDFVFISPEVLVKKESVRKMFPICL